MTVPLPKIIEGFSQGYTCGMESGDFEHAFLCLASCSVYQFAAGHPLDSTVDETVHTMKLVDQYKVDSVRMMLQHHLRAMEDLSGKTDDPLDWTDEETSPPRRKFTEFSEICQLHWRYLSRMQVAYYLGEYDLAYRLGEYFRVVKDADTSYVASTHGAFFRVVSSTAMYRKTSKRRYRVRALRGLKQMRLKMESTSSINNLHKFYILEADVNATLRIGKKNYQELYDHAISTSTKAGFLQDAALANELAGEHFLSEGDDFWARHYLTRAYSMYLTWEARAKTKQLLIRYGGLIETDSVLKDVHASRKSRRESTMSAVAMHHSLETGRSTYDSLSGSLSFEASSRFSLASHRHKPIRG